MKPVTIIGRGPSWKECPFSTEELWANATCLNTTGLEDKKYTKVFAFDQINGNSPLVEALAIAKERNIPIVSTWEYATEPYPLFQIARELGSSYLMPTVSYMIAYALFLKYERLWIFGIDQGPRWDYQSGKPHIAFWLGVATGRKVSLRIGRGSLRWSYGLGLSELPIALFEGEQNILAIREEEIKNER